MIAAATWLAEQGFCSIGWGAVSDGKGPVRRWKADATDDPALVPGLLHGARNALVIPKDRGIVIDIDEPAAWQELEAAGLPPTLTVDSPTPDHGHVYGWVPESVDMAAVPGTFAGGEIRRHDPRTGTASMVLGPWSLRSDGVYAVRNGVRAIATLPESVIDYLVTSGRWQDAERSAARGPGDPGWKVTRGRHPFLVDRARLMRGHGLTGARLLEEITRLDSERNDPPLASLPDRRHELGEIAGWTMAHIEDDPPSLIRDAEPDAEPDAEAGTEPATTPPALIVGIDAYRASVPATIPWVARPLAYLGGVSLIAGPPKAGKSTLAAQLQRCRETGERLFGAWDVTMGPTLLVTEEGGVAVVHKAEGLHTLDVLDRRSAVRAELTFRQMLGVVSEWAAARPGGLVFIDTLAIWAGIVDENDAGQATRAIAAVTSTAQAADLAIVLVHHARKRGGDDGEAVRGSGAILATVDIAIELSRVAPGRDDRYLDIMGRVIEAERFELAFDRATKTYTLADQSGARLAAIEADLDGIPADGPGLIRAELQALWKKDPRARAEQLVNVGRMRAEYVKTGRSYAWRYWSIPPAWTPEARYED
jgi:hypothetical protein